MTYETRTHTETRTVFVGEPGAPKFAALTFSGAFAFILVVTIASAVIA